MTYDGQPTRAATNLMKALVIITIIWVAYWAATGGLDRIVVSGAATTTSTTLAG